jgi:hypothetical protein
MKMKKLRAAKNIAPFAAACAPSLPCVRGASSKLRFLSCAADELFCGVPRAWAGETLRTNDLSCGNARTFAN